LRLTSDEPNNNETQICVSTSVTKAQKPLVTNERLLSFRGVFSQHLSSERQALRIHGQYRRFGLVLGRGGHRRSSYFIGVAAQGAHEQILIFLSIGQGLFHGAQRIGVANYGLQLAARAAGFKYVRGEVFGGAFHRRNRR
jgi:hypothetical protein